LSTPLFAAKNRREHQTDHRSLLGRRGPGEEGKGFFGGFWL
jgi:hypothetical protein